MLYLHQFGSLEKMLVVEGREFLPMFPGQYSLWLEKQLYSMDVWNHFNFVVKIQGNFRVDTAQKAVKCLADRYEILRTVFCTVKGIPIRKKLSSLLYMRVCDATALSKESVFVLMDQNFKAPFDLSLDVPFRFFLYKSCHNEWYFQMVAHHIAISLRGYLRVYREFIELYNNGGCDKGIFVEEEGKYSCFVEKYYEYFQGEPFLIDKRYWGDYLSGELLEPKLPLGKDESFLEINKEVYFLELEEETVAQVQHMAHMHHTSTFSFMVTIFQILQAFSLGRDESVVGIPCDIALGVIEKPVLGFTINVLPLRSRVLRGCGFLQIFLDVREAMKAMLLHRLYPTWEIVDNSGYRNLWKSLVVSQKTDSKIPCLNGVTKEVEIKNFPTGRFNFALAVMEEKGAVTLGFHYNTAIFDKDEIVQLGDCYLEILKGVIADPHKKIENLEKIWDEKKFKVVAP
jgi:surfactin family lipopeptide synthetase A